MRDQCPGGAIGEVPEWARELAKAARSLHDPNVRVLDLVFDSLLDEPASSNEAIRTLRFGSTDGVTVTLSVTREAGGLQAAVEIAPPRRYNLEIRHASGPSAFAQTDADGHSRIPALRSGLTSVCVVPQEGPPSDVRRTAWVPV